MTPRTLDADVVAEKLRLIRLLLDDLDEVATVTADRLRTDRLLRHAVERVLTQLVDLAVAINGHIAAAVDGRAPTTYRESFTAAANAGALPHDVANELAPSAGLRNVLVHEYVDIDLEFVATSVPHAREGYGRYVAAVARFLTNQAG